MYSKKKRINYSLMNHHGASTFTRQAYFGIIYRSPIFTSTSTSQEGAKNAKRGTDTDWYAPGSNIMGDMLCSLQL